MRRKLVAAAIAGGLAAAAFASAASADPDIGAPPDPPCFGQNISGFAQAFGGIPNAAEAFGVTIAQGHDIVRADLCGRTSGLVPAGS